jgi:hypothetical protein
VLPETKRPDISASSDARGAESIKPRAEGAPPQEVKAKEKDSSSASSSIGSVSAGSVQWKALLNYVKNKKMSAFTYLNAGKPVRFDSDRVVIGFGKDHAFNREALDTGDNRSFLEEALSKVTGSSPRLELTLLEFLGEEAQEEKKPSRENTVVKEDLTPMIEKAMDVFGGNIVRDSTEGSR